ncbi:MAG: PEP-CTERM sorting domain-containing protein, partial [Planctomycetia bacterium]|nr:PEP-CTERM sorting domain-containing protein [Planctomycetia bacterium]
TSAAANFGSNASILFSGTGSTLLAKGNVGTITQNIGIGATSLAADCKAYVDTGGYSMTLGGVLADANYGGGLVKQGAGTLTLTANETYTRDTVVSAGTLLVNGGLYTGTAAGTTTVDAGATLGGSGSIAGNVVVNGILSPGNSPGVLTVANLVLGGSSSTVFEINGLTRGTDYDGITLTGTSLQYGGSLALSFGQVLSTGTSTFDLFSWTGSPTITGALSGITSTGVYAGTWTTSDSGATWGLAYDANTTLSFTSSTGDMAVVVVPEPASIVLVALGAGGLLVAARRRKRA